MNSKLITILLCTGVFLSQTTGPRLANDQTCLNADGNWLANRNLADAQQKSAFLLADEILFAANQVTTIIRTAAFAKANAEKDSPNPTWVIADWVTANSYASADFIASNALAAFDWTAANHLTAAIWTRVYAEADAQKVNARAADAANVGNALDVVPAT